VPFQLIEFLELLQVTQYLEVLASNRKMLQLTARLGFSARADESDPRVMRVETKLLRT
jgi:hypothetical protein